MIRFLLPFITKAAVSAALRYSATLALGYALGKSPWLRRVLGALTVAAIISAWALW